MEMYNLDQITKKEIAASLGEVLCKHFVNTKGEEITFDEKVIKMARKEDLAKMLCSAIYDIVGIKVGDGVVPVDDPDLTGEGGEEGKYVDAARLSKETLHRFNLLIKEPEGGNGDGQKEVEPEKAKVKEQEVKKADKDTKQAEREAKKAQLEAEKAEKKKAAEEARAAKKAEKEAKKVETKKAGKTETKTRESKKGMNRMQSVLLAIAELGAFSTLEEVAVASDRIYLAANPYKFSNLKEPEGIAKWVTVALLATSFLRMEGGQYIVQGKLADDFLALKK